MIRGQQLTDGLMIPDEILEICRVRGLQKVLGPRGLSAARGRDQRSALFQETTRILTDAAFKGRTDYLLDFKSNLIMGHTIPGGTGFPSYKQRLAKYLDEEDEEALDFSFAESGKRSS